MGIQTGDTIYKVKKRFEVPIDGQKQPCTFIKLFEPTGEHTKFYMPLRKMIKQAEIDGAQWAKNSGLIEETQANSTAGEVLQPFHEKNEDEYQEETEGMTALLTFAMEQSERVDITKFLETFKKMLVHPAKKAIAKCEGRISFKPSFWHSMHPDEQFDLAIYWCSFFVMPSAEGKQNVSEPPLDYQPKLEVA